MELTRRYFLQSTGALTAYLGLTPRSILAGGEDGPGGEASEVGGVNEVKVNKGKTLVVIFLRGGADGLSLVVPYGDKAYADLRQAIAIPAPSAGERELDARYRNPNAVPDETVLDLDGFFGLHPRLAPLLPHFDSGLAVAAHAVGYDKNTRSHFEEQDVWETGIIGNTVSSDGWLNRHLATSRGDGRLRAVTIGDSLPRILHGKAAAYAVRGIEDLTMPDVPGIDPGTISSALEHAYCTDPAEHRGAARDLLARHAAPTLEGMKELRALTRGAYDPTVEYPPGELGRRLMQVARLIKADVGLEVAEVDFGGWDTHQDQGAANGMLGGLAGQLGAAMDAFARDLGDRMDDVLVVTLTDFGRTAAVNGTGGTDHGWANCMLLLGGAVARGHAAAADGSRPRKVVTDWPGLAPDQLHEERDLLHTTDFRDVLAELVRVHLGNPNLETVLPGHEFKSVGLIA